MTSVADYQRLIDSIRQLRRAERDPGTAAAHIAAVRADLERALGPTVSRARAARALGVSQTALDRWIRDGAVPVVIAPSGRREVPSSALLELVEELDRMAAPGRHPLARLLRERRERAQRLARARAARRARGAAAPAGHRDAERRGLAYHRAVADRLDERMVERARGRLERLNDDGRIHAGDYAAWRAILEQPLGQVREVLRADDERARELRQSAPFAGELDELERRELVEAIG